MKRTDIYLTEIQHKSIKKIADDKGISFSEMFRRIVDQYLEGSSCLNASCVKKNMKNYTKQSSARNRAV